MQYAGDNKDSSGVQPTLSSPPTTIEEAEAKLLQSIRRECDVCSLNPASNHSVLTSDKVKEDPSWKKTAIEKRHDIDNALKDEEAKLKGTFMNENVSSTSAATDSKQRQKMSVATSGNVVDTSPSTDSNKKDMNPQVASNCMEDRGDEQEGKMCATTALDNEDATDTTAGSFRGREYLDEVLRQKGVLCESSPHFVTLEAQSNRGHEEEESHQPPSLAKMGKSSGDETMASEIRDKYLALLLEKSDREMIPPPNAAAVSTPRQAQQPSNNDFNQMTPGAYAAHPGAPIRRTARLSFSRVTGGSSLPLSQNSSDHQPFSQQSSHTYVINEDPPACNDCLATAQPVEDPPDANDLPQARESDVSQRIDEKRKQTEAYRKHIIGFMVVGILVSIILAVVFGFRGGNNNNNTSTTAPTSSPTLSPTVQSVQDKILMLLPDSTLESVSDSNSSQALALEWMIDDPRFDNYSEDHIRQRFALATIYFATGGDAWTNNTDWLSYDVHECLWFNKVQVNTRIEGRTYDYLPWIWPNMSESLCNSHGQYERLWLSRNDLNGTIPQELFFLTDLLDLNIFWNQHLVGTIPSQYISQLAKLTGLELTGTGLTGTIPTEIGLLTNLKGFGVQVARELAGTIPTELGLLTDMRILKVDSTSLSGTIPSEIGLMTKLNALFMGSEPLHSTIPEEVIHLKELHEFHVSRCNVNGTIPTEIGLWSNLLKLFIFDTQMTGSIPSEIGGLKNLERLTIAYNMLASPIPSTIGLLEHLMVVGVVEMLTGTIPTEVGLLPFLGNTSNMSLSHFMRNYYGYPSYLAIIDTMLTGSIPVEMSNMSSMEGLWLYGNQLTGTIPTEFGHQTQLIELLVHSNEMSGSIPSELGLMSGMSWFELQNNSFTGQLPTELGTWSDIWTFDVSDNKLDGLIPSEILSTFGAGNASSLGFFNIAGNTLSGTLPSQICELDNSLDKEKDDGLFFDCSDFLCGCNCSCLEVIQSNQSTFPNGTDSDII